MRDEKLTADGGAISPGMDATAEVARLRRQLNAVHRITTALHSGAGRDATPTAHLNEMERQALLVAIESLDAEGGTIYVHDPDKKVLIFKHVVNSDPAIVKKLVGMAMPESQGVAGAVFTAGSRRRTDRASEDPGRNRDIDQKTGFVTSNMLTVPLKSMSGNNLGVMQLVNKRHGEFDDDDFELLEILSSQAASAMETARLYEDARRASVINLIGDISHDVKNLLTPVVTGTQTLEMMVDAMYEDLDRALPELDEPRREQVSFAVDGVRCFYKEAFSMVYDGAQDAQERVREIADAIKGVVAKPHFELADFRERVEAVAKVLKVVAERKGVTIEIDGVRDTGPVEIDRKSIYNAIYNLINNAIPETPTGGKIMVRTCSIDFDGVPGLEVQVQDTGKGMPAHVRARMFTADAVSTKPGGTGLGTRIVKNVVELHHGKIWVDSEEGEGTTFTFQMPARQPKEGLPASA